MFEVNGSHFIKKRSEAKFEKIDHSTTFDLGKTTFIMGKFSFSPICAENNVFFVQFFSFFAESSR